MTFDTFQDEIQVVKSAEALLKSPEEVDFQAEYKKLIGDYKNLTKVSRRLVKMSDRSEESLRDSNEQLQIAKEAADASREETRQFIAMISHELRTPLAILKSEVELLCVGIRKPNTENLDSLSEEVDHFSRLINDMFELSLTDINALNYQKEECDVVDLLTRTTQQFSSIFVEKKLALEFDAPKNTIVIHMDEQRIKQVFGNIIKNSGNYTDSGGKLVVSMRTEMVEESKQCIIEFSDTAPGLDDDGISKIFNRFYRGERSRSRSTGGAGLGMSICKGIMKVHKGSISAQHSNLGGVTIVITLPITKN